MEKEDKWYMVQLGLRFLPHDVVQELKGKKGDYHKESWNRNQSRKEVKV